MKSRQANFETLSGIHGGKVCYTIFVKKLQIWGGIFLRGKKVFWRNRVTKLLSIMLLLCMIIPTRAGEVKSPLSKSQAYVQKMGVGWNLGNSFDGFNTDGISDETAWGNPIVTKEFIESIKARGYDSIRIPLTVHTRYAYENGTWMINNEWLERYQEVVRWAADANLYVMINLHHDSWIWLADWDGNANSEQYLMFEAFWEQLATAFKDFGDEVCFETINEPYFSTGSDEEKQQKLDDLNKVAYDIIRSSGGNNESRMIVMPTMHTNHEKCEPLLALIDTLGDENIIATIHYYSEWVYSANLGVTSFDEILWGEETPRTSLVKAFDTVSNVFEAKGIGVVVGEFGLLGYDAGEEVLQVGEELKYYEFAHEYARVKGFSMMFWDNGSGINRREKGFPWKKPVVGNMLEACMTGRSSYAIELDTVYINEGSIGEIRIPLTLNGNAFVGIEGLVEGTDYTYNQGTVILHESYVKQKYSKVNENQYGIFDELVFMFSSGANWHQYLVKCNTPIFSDALGSNGEGIVIPVEFNGNRVRRANAIHNGVKVGPNNWWQWLQYASTYEADYKLGTLHVKPAFFSGLEESVLGEIIFEVEFYDGTFAKYLLSRTGIEPGNQIVGVRGYSE
jgi:endoglucanase